MDARLGRGGANRLMAGLVATFLCILAGHAPAEGSGAPNREAKEALSNNPLTGSIPSSSLNLGGSSTLFIPVILSASGRNNSFFTSELTLTNRGRDEAILHYTYTAHAGGGSGTASDRLSPGQQEIHGDALAYLRRLGIPIPQTGNRLGTLRLKVAGSSEVGVSVRTATSVPEGRAGLAYPGIAMADGFAEAVYLCGLRQNTLDRSNVAFQNMGRQGSLTLRTTVYSGELEDSSPLVLPEVTLEPGGFHQINGILAKAGFAQGYVRVERVSGTAPFYAYGVINDQANSDGSFIFPLTAGSLAGKRGQTLPVMVETSEFRSELTVTNFSEQPRRLDFEFVSDQIKTVGKTAGFSMNLEAGEQMIVPDVVEYLRRQGAAGLGMRRGYYAGPLFVGAEGGDLSGIVVGARTVSSDGRGGKYGVYYSAVPDGKAFVESAQVEALQQNEQNRSNLALVNTGEVDDSPSVFQLDIYDGTTGMLANTVTGPTVVAKGWHQINSILGEYATGTTQGYVRISKISGNNPFLAYGVINDGGAPGERSGDGAYLPATVRTRDSSEHAEATDREALEGLYHTTNGPNWVNSDKWLSDAPVSEWFGVGTDGKGRVTSLSLNQNRLSGPIPPVLGRLSHLRQLYLASNQLSGPIPPELGQLSQLEGLNLEGNQLSGSIPPELSQLSQLQSLSLGSSLLSGPIPPELGRLNQLQRLHLSHIQLSGPIPAELGQLSQLQRLVLDENQLSGSIPPELGQLSQLQHLDLQSNQLSGWIPPELGQLSQLQWMRLSENQLSGPIPAELGELSQLQNLILSENQLSGSIPPELGQLSQLQNLNLLENQLSGPIPPELGRPSRLQWMFLRSNQLNGPIPPELGELSQLLWLELQANRLSGPIPAELGQLSQLQNLNLLDNQLSGSIPPELGRLSRLQWMFLRSNQLNGLIPPELGQLSQLQVLNLRSNQLSGPIPAELGQLSLLQHLLLRENQLGGAIPQNLQQLSTLRTLDIRSTQICVPADAALQAWLAARESFLSSGLDCDGTSRVLFSASSYEVKEGESVPVTVYLIDESVDPERSVTISLKTTLDGRATEDDYTGVPESVTLTAPATAVSFSFTAVKDDHYDPAEMVMLGFRHPLPSGVTTGSADIATVRIHDPAEHAELTDRDVLEGLYYTTNGPNWVNNEKWLNDAPLSEWFGVETDGNGRVTSLSLQTNGLKGLIPTVLGRLSHLQQLFLSGNQLSGPIPAELGQLSHLQILNLRSNQLSGPIPAELGQLSHLQILNLRSNQLRGPIPAELGQLSHLQRLDLNDNHLRVAVPAELGQLSQLQYLDLNENQLSGPIPAELGQLSHLQILNLRSNQLRGPIPAELSQLSHLQSLDLRGNRLRGPIPAELGQLSQLQDLMLNDNQLSGPVPTELGRLSQLRWLNLSGNQLNGPFPAELGQLSHLRWLDLRGNRLRGPIPAELGQLSHLQDLMLNDNQLSGPVPTELGRLSQLRWLDLSGNQLNGPVSAELGRLGQLQYLNLGENQLSGPVPAELGQLSQLLWLDLSGNQLSALIPAELGQLSQLQWLDLSGNQLSALIPAELGQLSQLRQLNLGGNQLSGPVPAELGQLSQLQALILRFNKDLGGMIPTGMQQLALTELQLMASSVCVPSDAIFQDWLATIDFLPSGAPGCGNLSDELSSIDIAVMYTPAARRIAGGTAEMEAMIDLWVAETNQAYVDSSVDQQVVLTAREEVEYVESGSAFTDLDRLASPSDRYMDEVHAIRDRAGADLVHLIADVTDVSGIAYLPGAFGITCAGCDTTVFAHELGHNMGLSHDRYVTTSNEFPYSYGYINQQAFATGALESARWRTIMSYPNQCGASGGFSCDWIMRFSNPNQPYLGDALGVFGDSRTSAVTGPADAVRTLNITRHSVASFRPRSSGNRLTISSTPSQAHSMAETGAGGWPAALIHSSSLFRAIAPARSAAIARRTGGTPDHATLRWREVSVDLRQLARVSIDPPTTLRLNLFDDVVLTGIIERRTPTFSGGSALSGRLAGVSWGRVTLVVNGSVVAGTVRLPGATFRIRPAGAGRHAVIQVDPSQLPLACETVRPTKGFER